MALYPSARHVRWAGLEPVAKGRILEALMPHRNRLTDRTLRTYLDALARLAELGNLDEVESMGRIVSSTSGSPGRLGQLAAAYRLHCDEHRLPAPRIRVRREHRRNLPRIPADRALQARGERVGRYWSSFQVAQ